MIMFFFFFFLCFFVFFFFQAEDGIRDRSPSRGLGDVYKRQVMNRRSQEGQLLSVIRAYLQDLLQPDRDL